MADNETTLLFGVLDMDDAQTFVGDTIYAAFASGTIPELRKGVVLGFYERTPGEYSYRHRGAPQILMHVEWDEKSWSTGLNMKSKIDVSLKRFARVAS